jgi:cyclase
MKNFLSIAVLAFAALLPMCMAAGTPAEPEFRKLADGVYVYIGKLNDANAMAIVTSQGVVLVDTGNSQPESRNLLRHVQAVTQQPVRYVVITQNHGDHIGGTPLFSPPATVILHERVAKDWSKWTPRQINVWRKSFPERAEALKNFSPLDNVLTFREHMTLHLGGTTIELIYVDDAYNPGDVAVWLPESRVLHGAMAAYKDRHPDLRPDYSHGTTAGILKQLEAYIALQPKVVIPAHGPIGDAGELETMVDYLLTARKRVRGMIDQGLPLAEIQKQFHMNEFKDWDRTIHLPVMAAALYRELRGEGPESVKVTEKTFRGKITKNVEEGRYLTIVTDSGEELVLRTAAGADIVGIPDRSQFKLGMKISGTYEQGSDWNDALEVRVEQ